MGKSLIIPNADFSQNSVARIHYYFPYDLQDEIIDDSLLNALSDSKWGRFGTSKNVYNTYLAGKIVSGVKVLIRTPGIISFFKQDPVNGTSELFERLTFNETGWVTKRFSKTIVLENGIFLSIQSRDNYDEITDTGHFGYSGPNDNVRHEIFTYASSNITNGDMFNQSGQIYGFCFECLDLDDE